jgi:hypothetical protein
MRIKPYELPTYIDGSYYPDNRIIHFYEDMTGMHGGRLVHFYYEFNHAVAVIFLTEGSKKEFLNKLPLHEKSVGNSLKDYLNWRGIA